jgi:hypothetical protein
MKPRITARVGRILTTALLNLAFLYGAKAEAATYTTTFPLTENPISEAGQWAGGSTAGGNLWGDVRTTPGFAYGVSEPTSYGDPTAILQGTWGPNQTVSATVKINTTPTGNCCHEAEVRLRNTISPSTITGYEVYCSVNRDNPYCHIASWGGPNGAWVNMEASSPAIYLRDGDVLKGTVTGTNPVTITMFVNGSQVITVKDSGTYTFSDGKHYGPWPSGKPGLGFFDNVDNNWSRFGFSSFTASDGVTAALSRPVSVDRRNGSDLVEIIDLKGRVLMRNSENRNGNSFPAGSLHSHGVFLCKVVSGAHCTVQKKRFL